jgi:hypothetical protein
LGLDFGGCHIFVCVACSLPGCLQSII